MVLGGARGGAGRGQTEKCKRSLFFLCGEVDALSSLQTVFGHLEELLSLLLGQCTLTLGGVYNNYYVRRMFNYIYMVT